MDPLSAVVFWPLALLAWIALTSIFAYTLFRHDKAAAMTEVWRVPEVTLLLIALIGGWPGAKIAQRRFRHKTRKQPFGMILNATAIGPLYAAATIAVGICDDPLAQVRVPYLEAIIAEDAARRDMPRRFGPSNDPGFRLDVRRGPAFHTP